MSARTPSAIPAFRRKLIVGGSVVLLHLGALWALQSGLLHQPTELFVPVEIVTRIITPPASPPAPPVATPVLPPQSPAPKPTRAAEPARHGAAHKEAPLPAPKLAAAPELPPAPDAPTGVPEPRPAPPPATAAVAAAPAPAPAPAHAPIELPVSDADYLHNPKPAYPPTSKRLGEQGKVVLRVLIGVDGKAQDATVLASSGYDRLDRAALEAVRQWRYVPGKRGGVPEPMWVKVPIAFDLSE